MHFHIEGARVREELAINWTLGPTFFPAIVRLLIEPAATLYLRLCSPPVAKRQEIGAGLLVYQRTRPSIHLDPQGQQNGWANEESNCSELKQLWL